MDYCMFVSAMSRSCAIVLALCGFAAVTTLPGATAQAITSYDSKWKIRSILIKFRTNTLRNRYERSEYRHWTRISLFFCYNYSTMVNNHIGTYVTWVKMYSFCIVTKDSTLHTNYQDALIEFGNGFITASHKFSKVNYVFKTTLIP